MNTHIPMHPDYFKAKRLLDQLVLTYPSLRGLTVAIGYQWDYILEKDPTGQQCLHYVQDLTERLTPMEK